MKKEKSCGAIVFNDNKVLIVKQKNGDFGFPKGHVEENETEIETAIRETKEETNVDITINKDKRYVTHYIVKGNTDKEVVYFEATALNNVVIPQEGEINETFWIDKEEVENVLTHDNIKKLWKEAISKKD